MYDIAIIGCGVVGAAASYELSKYHLNIVVIEKENDIADATTKANSAIVHAGYDPEPGTKMAELNVKGSEMIEKISKKLSVHYKKCGSLVLAFSDDDLKSIEKLYKNGIENKVPDIKLLNKEEVLKIEPNINKDVKAALFAPSAAIINPWELCIAMADTSKRNGVEFLLSNEVKKIEKDNDFYILKTNENTIKAKYIINASGVHADTINNMIAEPEFKIIPSKGQYYLMDKSCGNIVNHVIFQCPNKFGKGVLVSPTVHGNLIVGPDSVNGDNPDDVSTTQDGLDFVRNTALKSVPELNFRNSIRNFAGERAQSDYDDFIIKESKTAKGFINLAGIKSPGLSSAPAIALECINILKNCGLELKEKENYIDKREVVRFKELSAEDKKVLIEKNPLYGRVICRCETITEGEIVDALHSPITPTTVDGIKKRCNAGMGRCQGGFCGPRVQEIISRELNIPMQDILLNKNGTYILTGETKKGGVQ